jgi:hypothetical protein
LMQTPDNQRSDNTSHSEPIFSFLSELYLS